jgi:hypothetical protein
VAAPAAPQFVVEKTEVKGRVVDDQFRIPDEVQELVSHIGKAWLISEKFIGDAMNPDRFFVDEPIRLQVNMESPVGGPPVQQFEAADLDDPMPLDGIKARRFSIQDDLPFIHGSRSLFSRSKETFTPLRIPRRH